MATRFFWGDYIIEKDWQEMELHYIIFDGEGYVCRLVPGEMGLELSAQDLALDHQRIGDQLREVIGFIESYEA
jgi:hypothetical protein